MMGPTLDTNGRILHTFFTRTRSATHPHQQCSSLFYTQANFLPSLDRTHERRQLFRLVGRLGMEERMDRLLVSGPHASHADHRRADHKRCPQATRSTKANDGHDEEEITQNRDGTRHVDFQRQRRPCSHGGRHQGARTAGGGQTSIRSEVRRGCHSGIGLPRRHPAHAREDRSS